MREVKIFGKQYEPIGEFDHEELWCDLCDLSIESCDLDCKRYHCEYLRRR